MNFLIECSICKKILEQPVTLACNHTICKTHLNEKETIQCKICHIVHYIHGKAFPSNLLTEIDLGPEYKQASESLKCLKNLLGQYKHAKSDPELEIDRAFGDLRNKINLRREKKMSMGKEGLELIVKIENCKNESKAAIKEKNKWTSVEILKFLKTLLDEITLFENELKTLTRNPDKWKILHSSCMLRYVRLKQEYEKINPLGECYKQIKQEVKQFCEEEETRPLLYVNK